MPKLLTVTEAAAIRGVDKSTVSRWVNSGGLKHVRLGRAIGIAARDLAAFTPPPVGNPAARRRRDAIPRQTTP